MSGAVVAGCAVMLVLSALLEIGDGDGAGATAFGVAAGDEAAGPIGEVAVLELERSPAVVVAPTVRPAAVVALGELGAVDRDAVMPSESVNAPADGLSLATGAATTGLAAL